MDRSGKVTVGDVELFVREIGPDQPPSPPLVAIHGGPSWDHSYLLPGLLPVARSRHVIVFDMRGCGRSTCDLGADAYQPELVVEDLAKLIEVLGHDQVDLLGFSTGGQVAQLFAQAHPDRIRRLVLASTTAYPDPARYLEGWAEYERRVANVHARDNRRDDRETTIQAAIKDAPLAIWNLELVDDYLALLDQVRFTDDWVGPTQPGQLHPWRPPHPEDTLRRLGRPVLILHGAQDMGFPLPLARRLHEAVPNSRLEIIDQSGHMAQFEHPDQWSRAVLDFLSAESRPAQLT